MKTLQIETLKNWDKNSSFLQGEALNEELCSRILARSGVDRYLDHFELDSIVFKDSSGKRYKMCEYTLYVKSFHIEEIDADGEVIGDPVEVKQ